MISVSHLTPDSDTAEGHVDEININSPSKMTYVPLKQDLVSSCYHYISPGSTQTKKIPISAAIWILIKGYQRREIDAPMVFLGSGCFASHLTFHVTASERLIDQICMFKED